VTLDRRELIQRAFAAALVSGEDFDLRAEQVGRITSVESTAGLYGDLQGIAGRSLLEIAGLEVPLLDGPTAHPRTNQHCLDCCAPRYFRA